MNLDLKTLWKSLPDLTKKNVSDEFINIQKWWNDHNYGYRIWDRVIAFGTTTNDNAVPRVVGEYISSYISTPTNFPATTVIGDLTSITLTAGDWDISLIMDVTGNATGTEAGCWISTTSGNSSTGQNVGDNTATTPTLSTAAADASLVVPSWRASISSTTTYYFKYQAVYSIGTPQARGRISARRVR